MKQLRVQTNIFIIIDLLTNFITVTLTYQSAARLPASNMQAMFDKQVKNTKLGEDATSVHIGATDKKIWKGVVSN